MGNDASPLRLVISAPAEPSDAELVIAARGGDDEARHALFSRHFVGINQFVARVMAHSYEVEDVVQDSFIEAMAHLKALKDPASFRGWLRTIAVSQIRRRMRRNRLLFRLGLRDLDAVEIEAVVSDETPAETKVELRQVFSLMRALPADEGLALVLRRVEGLQLTEIAEQMKLSLATVKRKLDAAEQHLARMAEDAR